MTHAIFEYLAFFVGFQFYRQIKASSSSKSLLQGGQFWIVVGCVFGAAIGNKLVFWIENPTKLEWQAAVLLLSGQSLVGGLIGGLIGVEIAKYLLKTKYSTGDDFVYPILLGIAIGRVGCFLAGLKDGTYGVATQAFWAIDFGDGIPRHPTQLYEILFVLMLWAALKKFETLLNRVSGLRFRLMLSAYLIWRLLVDGIKPIPYLYPLALSGIQWVCLITIILYSPNTIKLLRKLKYES